MAKASIEVKYGYTVEGTLTITITDLISGKSTSEIKRGLGGSGTAVPTH